MDFSKREDGMTVTMVSGLDFEFNAVESHDLIDSRIRIN